MKCEKCPADSALGCTAGVKPYQLRSGDTGCAWNLRIIKKHMNQSKPTNYDRLISKTPEEMAQFLSANDKGAISETGKKIVYESWLAWLKQEATDERK